MAERGTVMGDLRCGLRHRLGDNALVGRGVSPDRRSPVRGGYAYQEIRIIRKVGFALSGRRRGRVRPRPVNIG